MTRYRLHFLLLKKIKGLKNMKSMKALVHLFKVFFYLFILNYPRKDKGVLLVEVSAYTSTLSLL